MEFLLSDLQVAMSVLPESAINTPYQLSADFMGMRLNAMPPMVPQAQTQDDADMIGGGDEFANDVRLYNWLQQPHTINGKLNSETAGNWLLRALMGTVTDAVVTATKSWDHSAPMQTRAQGRTPKYTTLIMNLGGADVLAASMAVNSFTISQQGTAEPTFSVEVIGTGKFQRLRDIVSPAIVIPQPVAHHYPHGAANIIVLNDGVVKNLSSLGRVRSWSVSLQNNLVTNDRRPGDPFKTSGDVRTGSYVRSLLRGKRTASAQIKLALDENLSELDYLTSNTTLTSLSIKNVGEPITASPDNYEVEWKVPKFKLQTLTGDSEGDDATITLNFLPLRDSVSGGLVTGRIRNDQATMV
jgi:hypothetical protein